MVIEGPPAVEIRELRVDYGNFAAVRDISLTIPQGEVWGLLGPNGAGKTSTFKVLATLAHPTYGEVRMCGHDLFEETEAVRRVLGYMPDLAPVPTDLKAWEFLDFYARGHGLQGTGAREVRVAECLDMVQMTSHRDSWCHQLSRGQTQRLVLAKTLLHRPKVLILDEPASGMDPLSRRDLRHTVQRLAEEGATVIISSHILSELADMCSSLCVMNKGRILSAGPVAEVQASLGGRARALVVATLADEGARAEALVGAVVGVTQLVRSGDRLSFRFAGSGEEQAELLRMLVAGGVRVRCLEEQRTTFEDILITVAEGNRHAA